ncbi:MAG: hypothetical protein IJJ94_01905 [Bacteroidaceae bacterium]|nr:hypothetical protein [Bacteroidaceae bacterium]
MQKQTNKKIRIMRHLFYPFILLATMSFAMTTLPSCSDDDINSSSPTEYVAGPQGLKIPVELVDKSKLPQWIIDFLGNWPAGEGVAESSTYVYKGKWQGKTIYLIHNSLMSSFYYNLYDSKGNRLEHGDNREIIDKSSDWKCIYIH